MPVLACHVLSLCSTCCHLSMSLQIHLAHTASVASLYIGSIAGSLLVIFSLVLFTHYRRLKQAEQMMMSEREPMMNVAGQGDPYGSVRTQQYQ